LPCPEAGRTTAGAGIDSSLWEGGGPVVDAEGGGGGAELGFVRAKICIIHSIFAEESSNHKENEKKKKKRNAVTSKQK
jgi:hypothetical protein